MISVTKFCIINYESLRVIWEARLELKNLVKRSKVLLFIPIPSFSFSFVQKPRVPSGRFPPPVATGRRSCESMSLITRGA